MQMGIDQNAGRGGKGNGSNDSSRKNRRRQKRVSAVQRLYDVCKEVFADSGPDIVPSPQQVERIAALLDGMSQADVGLRPNMPYFSVERAPIITYLHLHECQKFSICIFCLPPTSIIPLHNHPGMTVFSKLLFGTMHIRSFDWSTTPNADDDNPNSNNNGSSSSSSSSSSSMRLAKLKVNSEFTAPCSTSILYPSEGGNMHCFTARTACAFLDVLGPPYCDAEGRHCQYYQEEEELLPPFSHQQGGGEFMVGERKREELLQGYAWLKEMETPQQLSVVGAPYNGPKITRR